MTISEEIQLLIDGFDPWNEKRADNRHFKPDFQGVNLAAEFAKAGKYTQKDKDGIWRFDLKKFDLEDANFSDAEIRQLNLDNAILTRARFINSNLAGSSFLDVKMCGTDFSRANLAGSDFTGVKFSNANLTKADLTHAQLEKADLRYAVLSGARLAGANPWKAHLYPGISSVTAQNVKVAGTYSITRLSDLMDICRDIASRDNEVVLYFRGEKRKHGSGNQLRMLQPSVMRSEKLMNKEGEMLRKLMSRRPEDFPDGQSAFSQWVRAQHHGLKTRFLDVSRNPHVALFFSCVKDESGKPETDGRIHIFSVPLDLIKPFNSDTIRIISNFAKMPRNEQKHILGYSDLGSGTRNVDTEDAVQRLYDFVREEKPAFAEKIDPRDFYRVFVVEPQQSFARIRAQSGAFMVSAFHERFERNVVLNFNSDIPIYGHHTVDVPKQHKEEIRKELEIIQVTVESLFPSLDQSAQAVINEIQK